MNDFQILHEHTNTTKDDENLVLTIWSDKHQTMCKITDIRFEDDSNQVGFSVSIAQKLPESKYQEVLKEASEWFEQFMHAALKFTVEEVMNGAGDKVHDKETPVE